MRLAAVVLLVVGLPLHAAPAPKDKAPLYHATAVGAKLVYEVAAGGQVAQQTDTVVAADVKDGAVVISLRQTGTRIETLVRRVAVSGAGLVAVSVGAHTYDPPDALLRLPARAGDAWERVPTKKECGISRFHSRVVGEEDVVVPAGKFKAVRVDVTTVVFGTELKASNWYAPGVGLVKQTNGDHFLMVLKSFTPGK